ncbi:MAG: hypothetical protein AB7K68_11135 [Bacteriovoracia bacterium]
MSTRGKKLRNYALLGLWLAILTGGFWHLLIYANTEGVAARSTPDWPATSNLKRGTGQASLVVFAHPQCPCSAATLGELERLLPKTRNKIENFVVFVKPSGVSDDWAKEKLWQKSESIPGVHTHLDEGGKEATLFGAKTSGQVFLFDEKGKLVFSGGITPGRGHMGDNNGRSAVLAFAENKPNEIRKTPVYGCSLFGPERTLARKKK